MIIPTGIGCEIGGYCGKANAAARLLAQCCDTLILHPNVVNASDINEIPENFIHRLLKGLHKAPRISHEKGLSVQDVDCMVSPYGCLGVPHQACLDAHVPVIAVRENKSCLRHPERKEFIYVENYREAARLLMAMQAEIHPASVRRPLQPAVVK